EERSPPSSPVVGAWRCRRWLVRSLERRRGAGRWRLVVATWFSVATRALSRPASLTRLACRIFPTRRDEIATG
ncbi:hypothetical protein Taro_024636, partial [Colocasia esculenta]|nr:hypothetical protein [Colocasia esculenta]